MTGFREYLSYSEKYLQIIDSQNETSNIDWLLIPALILAWSAVESFVNNMLDDFSNLPPDLFQLHERSLLLEQKIKFIDSGTDIGKFKLEGLEFKRLEDKIFFLIAKFSEKESDNIKGDRLWQKFQDFKDVRDLLVHPRRSKPVILDKEKVEVCIITSREIIDLISQKVWGKKIIF